MILYTDVTESVEQTDIPNHLDSMAASLIKEHGEHADGDMVGMSSINNWFYIVFHQIMPNKSSGFQGPCMEYLLRLKLLQAVVTIGQNDVI